MQTIIGKRQTGKTYNLIYNALNYNNSIILVENLNKAETIMDEIRAITHQEQIEDILICLYPSFNMFNEFRQKLRSSRVICVMTFNYFLRGIPEEVKFPVFIDDISSFVEYVCCRCNGGNIISSTLQYEECKFINVNNCQNTGLK